MNSSEFWQKPLNGTFKLNFDEAAKGNLGLASFKGAIRDSQERILSIYWGSLGTCTINLVELEGLINKIAWAIQNQ